MTIVEWDDVPIVLRLARGNVATLRPSEEGWAQALADAAGLLAQAERDALLTDDASGRSAGDKRLHEREEGSAHARTPMQTPATMRLIARLHAAEFERITALENKSALIHASEFAPASQTENAFELVCMSDRMHMAEDVARSAHVQETSQLAAPERRLPPAPAPHTRTAMHVAHVLHPAEHALHTGHATHTAHATHTRHATHTPHAAHAMSCDGFHYLESSSPDEGDDEISSVHGVSGRSTGASMTASAHKRGSTEQVSAPWLDGQQLLRSLRGAAGTVRTAPALLASMRRTSLRDDTRPQGLALARGPRAGGPWLRRVTHAYVGRDGVTLWVRDAKMNRHGASALMSALHRWADVAGVKIAAVICNGKMLYRAAHASATDITGDCGNRSLVGFNEWS